MRLFSIKNKKVKEKPKQPNTLVLDRVNGFGLEYIEKPQGHLRLYGKQWVYLMVRRNGTIVPFELPKKLGLLPEVLYRALSWEKETKILFTLESTLLEKFSTFGTYILIGVLLFFMYLIFSSL